MTTADARFWNRHARRYAAAKIGDRTGYERSIDRTRALLDGRDRVLEIACGTGMTALRLAPAVPSYRATDISGGMIEIARERLAADPVDGLVFDVAAADGIPPDAGPFDAVLCFNGLHLLRDPAQVLRGIHAALVPGGLFVSKTPCLAEMTPLIRLALVPVLRAIGLAPRMSAFDAGSLARLIGDTGFEILATERHAGAGRDARPFIVSRKAPDGPSARGQVASTGPSSSRTRSPK